jgi:hypothetical protein
MHQFHVGEPEPGPCSCPEEEVLIFHQVREFRQVKLQDVGACATLDWRVQHLARDLVLHAGQSSPIRLLADSLGEQVGEDDVIEVIDDNRRGAGGLLACSNARSCIYAAIPILDRPLANRACTSVQMNAGISRQRVDDVDGARARGCPASGAAGRPGRGGRLWPPVRLKAKPVVLALLRARWPRTGSLNAFRVRLVRIREQI